MFDSPIYDPKAAWRYQPASERQRIRLNELGIPCSANVTKGEAANMISAVQVPGIEEIEFLEFFGISDAASLTQLHARRKIAIIIADPANRIKWTNRPATPDCTHPTLPGRIAIGPYMVRGRQHHKRGKRACPTDLTYRLEPLGLDCHSSDCRNLIAPIRIGAEYSQDVLLRCIVSAEESDV
jgi:hypothetical protein